ncbi:hypothetical protein [Pelotomaculum sp. FP]|uniref:hypothetical protein n=1 Tax=Pelotomaculum sp. FP TaxID=261474 RepID=UPI001FAA3815|nr:hypothetical protein [Pelotomaculum sp. FP]
MNIEAGWYFADNAAEAVPEYFGLACLLMKRRNRDRKPRWDQPVFRMRDSADFLLLPCHSEDRI